MALNNTQGSPVDEEFYDSTRLWDSKVIAELDGVLLVRRLNPPAAATFYLMRLTEYRHITCVEEGRLLAKILRPHALAGADLTPTIDALLDDPRITVTP